MDHQTIQAAHKPLFVFDLDSTVTKCEFLPLIAEHAGMGGEMAYLTEAAMQGEAPFEQDFKKRVELLKSVPLSAARSIAARIPLNDEIGGFIRENPRRCMILTGNLDAWIAPIIEKLGMKGRCLCSRAEVYENRLLGVASVLNKGMESKKLPRPFVAIGDGSNDIGMLEDAEIGIAFGGVRRPSEKLIAAADMVVWDERELVEILKKLL